MAEHWPDVGDFNEVENLRDPVLRLMVDLVMIASYEAGTEDARSNGRASSPPTQLCGECGGDESIGPHRRGCSRGRARGGAK